MPERREFLILFMLMGLAIAPVSLLAVTAERSPACKDPKVPVEERGADLLRHMTLEDKVAQSRGGYSGTDAYVKRNGTIDIAEASEPLLTGAAIGMLGLLADPVSEIKMEGGLSRREGAEFLNPIQRYVREHAPGHSGLDRR